MTDRVVKVDTREEWDMSERVVPVEKLKDILFAFEHIEMVCKATRGAPIFTVIPHTMREIWAIIAAPQPANVTAARPKIVCLCGSTRFVAQMACIAWALERDEGYITLGLHLLPDDYPGVQADHMAEAEGRKEHMDELHKRKIDLCDEVLVLNIGGYIGKSTRSEIDYAIAHGKPVKYMEKES